MTVKAAWLVGLILSSFTFFNLQAEEGFVDLFDGKTLKGWTQRNGTATYEVVDGTIKGTTADGSPNSFLCSDKLYSDFELLFKVKVHARLNSGVQIRSKTYGGPKGRVNGPQVEIEASGAKGAEAGYVWGEALRTGWWNGKDNVKPHKHFKDGEWNQYRILAKGPSIKVWINDNLVTDITSDSGLKSHPKGFIGLQVHSIRKGSGPWSVQWKDIKIKDLVASSNDAGWTDLLEGGNLDAWQKTDGNWKIVDNNMLLIEPRKGERGWKRFSSYIYSKKQYGDFVLDLEYNYPKGGNSGVFFRIALIKDPVNSGMEAQILDSSKKKGKMTHHDHGGIIRTQGASKNMSKQPGEWNRMIVTAKGNHLKVNLNGEEVINLQLDQTSSKDKPKSGFIGLQDHGQPHNIKFRNIRIKEL